MRKLLLTLIITIFTAASMAQNKAVFDSFKYTGVNRFADKVNKNQFQNPILSGFMPDPSICRKGGDYYLINSTFSYFPGVPIWHSTDLVNWKQIGHVLNRESQLRIGRSRMSGGVYAPAIEYNPHDDKFYMITTGTGHGGTAIFTTDDPKKQNWSDPVVLREVGGIDPSLFFDDDGRAYIVNNDEPAYTAEYDGHRAIWVREYDWKNGKTVGKQQVLIDKGIVKEDKPIWIEGPHLYKINGKYFLMAAEGGTAEMHSEVILTSNSPLGPFTPCKINPILTQRSLPENRKNPVTSAGHADLIQTEAGDWYAVFLACMPYRDGLYNTGRETFMLPVKWQDGQPVILPDGEEIPYFVNKSEEQKRLEKKSKQKGFDFYNPGKLWSEKGLPDFAIFVRNPSGNFYSIDKSGRLHLQAKETGIHENSNPAFICQRITSWTFNAETTLEFVPSSEKEFAGIALFQNESFFIQFGKSKSNSGKSIIILEAVKNGKILSRYVSELPENEAIKKLTLKVVAETPESYAFSYSANRGKTWNKVGDNIDATLLSTQIASGFQGACIGVYATGKYKNL